MQEQIGYGLITIRVWLACIWVFSSMFIKDFNLITADGLANMYKAMLSNLQYLSLCTNRDNNYIGCKGIKFMRNHRCQP